MILFYDTVLKTKHKLYSLRVSTELLSRNSQYPLPVCYGMRKRLPESTERHVVRLSAYHSVAIL